MKWKSWLIKAPYSLNFDPRGRPQSRPVMITIFTHVVRTSVRPSPLFKIYQNNTNIKRKECSLLARLFCGMAEWIIDDSCLVFLVDFLPSSQFSLPAVALLNLNRKSWSSLLTHSIWRNFLRTCRYNVWSTKHLNCKLNYIAIKLQTSLANLVTHQAPLAL